MQLINLTPIAARCLAHALTEALESENAVLKLERVEIRCGDASGSPKGWVEFDFQPVYENQTLPLS